MAELTHLTTEFSTIPVTNVVRIVGNPMDNSTLYNDVEALLEKGKTITNNIYYGEGGEKINLCGLMNLLLDDDPWMNEDWTEEEKKQIIESENSGISEEW